MNKKQIGQYISKVRKEKKMTQKDLANQLFVSFQAVSKWERGISLPDMMMLEKIVKVLDVSMYELLYRSSSKYPLEQLIDKLNEEGINKDNYNDIALLVQSGFINSTLEKITNPPVIKTLKYAQKNIAYFEDLKLIKCAHELVRIYVEFLDIEIEFTSQIVQGIKFDYFIGELSYDNVLMNKIRQNKIVGDNHVMMILNTDFRNEHLYVFCSDNLLDIGFSAYFIATLITRAITIPSDYGLGGGGLQNRAGFSLKKDCLVINYKKEAYRLMMEYLNHFQDFKVQITSHTK